MTALVRHMQRERILAEEAQRIGVTAQTLKGPSRRDGIVRARWRVMYRLKSELGLSASRIGQILNRDHTTVLHGLRMMRAQVEPTAMVQTARGWHLGAA